MPGQYSDFNNQVEDDTTNKKKQSLQDVLRAGSSAIGAGAVQGDPAAPPTKQDSTYWLDQMRKTKDQYAPSAPPETRQALADALDKAEQLYKDQASKNEWAEVAQMLAQAVGQGAAGYVGAKQGIDPSNYRTPGGIDYGARTERAARDYARTAQNLGDVESAGRRDFEAGSKFGESGFHKDQDVNEAGLRAALRSEEIARSEGREDRRTTKSEKDVKDREDRALRAQQLQDLNSQEKGLSAQLKARQTLINLMQQEDDLSGKSAAKLQEKYGPLAAQGDIDLAELQTEMEKKTKPGRLSELTGGIIGTTNPDEEGQKSLLRDKVDEVRNLLAGIHARKASLLEGSVGKAPDQPRTEQEPPPPKTIKVKGPSGQIAEMTPENAAKYLSQPGYSEVK